MLGGGSGCHPVLWAELAAAAELGAGLCFPIGFLEKNRDVLSEDILTLVYSSQNKFLREIFRLESVETKRGLGTIIQANAGSRLFKVGSGRPTSALGTPPWAMGLRKARGGPTAWVSQSGHRGDWKQAALSLGAALGYRHRTLPASQPVPRGPWAPKPQELL